MATVIKQKDTSAENISSTTQSKAKNLWAEAEKGRFGIIPLLLTVVACMSGIAAAYGTGYGVFQLSLVAFPTMITLSLILGVAPMKQIIYAGAITVLLDILVLIF